MRPAYAFHLASRSPGARESLPSLSFSLSVYLLLSFSLCVSSYARWEIVSWKKWSPRPTNYSFSCDPSCPSDSFFSHLPCLLACLPAWSATGPTTGVLGCIRITDVIIHAPNSPCSPTGRVWKSVRCAAPRRIVGVNYFCIPMRATSTPRVI